MFQILCDIPPMFQLLCYIPSCIIMVYTIFVWLCCKICSVKFFTTELPLWLVLYGARPWYGLVSCSACSKILNEPSSCWRHELNDLQCYKLFTIYKRLWVLVAQREHWKQERTTWSLKAFGVRVTWLIFFSNTMKFFSKWLVVSPS